MKNLKIQLQNILSWICAAIFTLMVIIGTWQVMARYMFNSPSAWTEEVLTYAFVWLSLLAATVVAGKREHMRLTFVVDKFQPRTRAMFEIAMESIFAIFSVLIFVYGGYEICKLTMTQITPALQLHMGKVYAIMPICGCLMIFFGICNIREIAEQSLGGDSGKAGAK